MPLFSSKKAVHIPYNHGSILKQNSWAWCKLLASSWFLTFFLCFLWSGEPFADLLVHLCMLYGLAPVLVYNRMGIVSACLERAAPILRQELTLSGDYASWFQAKDLTLQDYLWCAWACHWLEMYQIRSDQLLSHVRLFATPWIAARQTSLSITNSRIQVKQWGGQQTVYFALD